MPPVVKSLAFRLAAEKVGGERALKKMLRDYRRTLSYEEISRRLHADEIASVSGTTVQNWCERLGIGSP